MNFSSAVHFAASVNDVGVTSPQRLNGVVKAAGCFERIVLSRRVSVFRRLYSPSRLSSSWIRFDASTSEKVPSSCNFMIFIKKNMYLLLETSTRHCIQKLFPRFHEFIIILLLFCSQIIWGRKPRAKTYLICFGAVFFLLHRFTSFVTFFTQQYIYLLFRRSLIPIEKETHGI